MEMNDPSDGGGGSSQAQKSMAHAGRIYQTYLDKTTIYVKERWLACALLLCLYILRVYLLAGFYIVSYGLGIYLLNIAIGFLSPAIDPEEEGAEDDDSILPMGGRQQEEGEFRPFTRKLPEFKAWHTAIKAVAICIVMTFFDFFDLPVFWPILLGYFLLLVFITMKERARHMIKHQYIPFDVGKKTYRDLTKVTAGQAQQPSGKSI